MKRHVGWIIMSVLSGLATLAGTAAAQSPARWLAHDMQRPRPPVVTPGKQSLPVQPPSDAIVVFDGSDLSKWRDAEGGPAKWRVQDGYMESVADSGYVFSAGKFGDVQLHIEWATPVPASGHGQGRGNSGLFLMGLYEVQVLDSYENDTYPDGQAGAIYGQHPPLVNACLPPGEWQSYDIVFRRPRFHGDGTVATPARITVVQNGVLVQDDVEIWGPTAWLQYIPYHQHDDKLPISLQDHGNPVRYRNIWLRELAEPQEPDGLAEQDPATVQLSPDELKKFVGDLRQHTRRDGNDRTGRRSLAGTRQDGAGDRPGAALAQRIRDAVHRRQARLQRERPGPGSGLHDAPRRPEVSGQSRANAVTELTHRASFNNGYYPFGCHSR